MIAIPLLERAEVGDVGAQMVQPLVLRAQVQRQVQRRARAPPARAARAAAPQPAPSGKQNRQVNITQLQVKLLLRVLSRF